MVDWNSSARGIRLGESDGIAALTTWCNGCRSFGESLPLARAVAMFGAGAHLRDIAQRLRCTRCGARQASVQLAADTLSWRKGQG